MLLAMAADSSRDAILRFFIEKVLLLSLIKLAGFRSAFLSSKLLSDSDLTGEVVIPQPVSSLVELKACTR